MKTHHTDILYKIYIQLNNKNHIQFSFTLAKIITFIAPNYTIENRI